MIVAGANVHDTKLLEATLEAIVVERPAPTEESPQNPCMDKAYDNPTGHRVVPAYGYQGHIRRIGEEKLDEQGEKKHPARRWVVERIGPGGISRNQAARELGIGYATLKRLLEDQHQRNTKG